LKPSLACSSKSGSSLPSSSDSSTGGKPWTGSLESLSSGLVHGIHRPSKVSLVHHAAVTCDWAQHRPTVWLARAANIGLALLRYWPRLSSSRMDGCCAAVTCSLHRMVSSLLFLPNSVLDKLCQSC
jgi:hypothetical protein